MGTETPKENLESFIFILDTLGTWEQSYMFPRENTLFHLFTY